ncbi:MAG: hypothetical protein JWQ54_1688 [Mucilaginibacter sp.]|nr:hypothetical protein [Mucilaginibacter sp.]
MKYKCDNEFANRFTLQFLFKLIINNIWEFDL